MSFHPQRPLTFGQMQTGSNRVDRRHFQVPQFPGPNTPSQQFSIEGGLQQLTFEENRALDRVINSIKKQRQGSAVPAGVGGFASAFKF